MAAGPGSTDAENGVTMAARDRFAGPGGSTGPGETPDAPAGTGSSAGPDAREPQTRARRRRGWRSTATPPTAAGKPASPTGTPGTPP